jgi:AcrR family transcriptional regulator
MAEHVPAEPAVEPPALPVPPRRADARRNYDAVVAAAQEAFAREGVGTSIDDIARAAGVGSATLYRHFPTRDDLVVAAISQDVVVTHDRGVELLGAPDPLAALREWLLAVIAQNSTYGGLPASVLDAADRAGSLLGVTCTRMQRLNSALLARAQEAGGVCADLTADELFDLVSGIAWTVSRNRPDDRGARLLDLALHGVLA